MPTIEVDPYASHLPVLQALSRLLPMRRVLELGSGRYSTPFFLGLPQLECLVTFETNPDWYTETSGRRHTTFLVENCAAELPKLDGFDLVFVDDSEAMEDRLATIKAVLTQSHPPVVIHDAEVPEYAAAIKRYGRHSIIFEWGEPQTALVWQ